MSAPGGLLVFEAVVRVYAEGRVRALDGVSLTLGAGEMVAVTGASGSGKSTLLHLAGALDQPDQGRVSIDGETVDPARADRLRSEVVGFVFQHHYLLPHLCARENVEIPMWPTVASAPARAARARELLAKVGLAGREDHYPGQLSGGEAQRVGIARALANRPRLLLMDEPTGELDSASGAMIMDLVAGLNRDDLVSVLLVTHDHAIARRAPRNVVLADGKVVADRVRSDPLASDLDDLRRSTLAEAVRRDPGDPRLAALGIPDAVLAWLRGAG